MNEQSHDAIMERILACLRLASDEGATPHEAEAAAAMASKLMYRYQIDQAKVYAKQRAERPSERSNLYAREYVTITKSMTWERELLAYLCAIHDLHVYSAGRWRFEIIGHVDNVRLVVEMFGWLRDEFNRMAKAAYRRERPANDLGHSWDDKPAHMDPLRFHVSFKRGATVAVWERLNAQKREAREEAKRTAEGQAALMVIADDKNRALVHFYPYLREHYFPTEEEKARREAAVAEMRRKMAEERASGKKRRTPRGRVPRQYEPDTAAVAYHAGRIAGQTVRLNNRREIS